MQGVRAPYPPTPEALAQQVLDATVYITSIAGHGSGFFIDEQTIMTARHVAIGVMVGKPHRIITRDGQDCLAVEGKLSGKADVAIVTVTDCKAPHHLTIYHDPQVGSHILTAGHPITNTWAVSAGIIAQIDVADVDEGIVLHLTSPAHGGMSGGPVVDEHGHLVGMVVAIWGSTSVWGGMTFAVPSDRLAAIMTELALMDDPEAQPSGGSGG